MKVFVTGGTGFIGGALIRRLLARGDQVSALVRSPEAAEKLRAQGVTPVLGDVRDIESMREGMRGSEVVFHAAAWYKVGAKDWQQAEAINVEGTRSVLSLAHELGVPRIVYTSTVAVYGDTRGRVIDESLPATGETLLTEYDRTKWKAHRVAESLIERGAPVIIVMPGAVYGPGDHSQVGEMMQWFFKGRFPIFPAPDFALTFAHIDDIVEGHLLAAERGRPGEGYFLTGPSYTLRQMLPIWSEISGRPEPLFSLPPALVTPFAPVMGWLSRYIEIPSLLSEEAVRIVGASYLARSEKARRELGWTVRPVAEGMRETFAHLEQTVEAPPVEVIENRQKAVAGVLAGLAVFLVLRLFRPRRRRS